MNARVRRVSQTMREGGENFMARMYQTHQPKRSAGPAAFEVVKQALAYWKVQDVEQTLAHYSEDIVYRSFTFHNAFPTVQVLRGRDEIRDMMFDVLAQFDYIRYEPVTIDVIGGIAHVQVAFDLRHRTSGEHLSGSKWQFFVVSGGQIQRIHQFHDETLVTAFLRMARG